MLTFASIDSNSGLLEYWIELASRHPSFELGPGKANPLELVAAIARELARNAAIEALPIEIERSVVVAGSNSQNPWRVRSLQWTARQNQAADQPETCVA